MGGGGTNTTTTTSQPSNPNVTATTNLLLDRLQGQVGRGTAVYEGSLYPGVSDTTRQGWTAATNAANNPTYSNGVQNSIAENAAIASGQRFGTNDPGYATLRANLGQDTLRDVNSAFNASGRFGGGSNVRSASEGLANAYAGLDYQNYQSDIARQQAAQAAMPGLYNASLLPSATIGQVGSGMDADMLARRQGDNDYYRRTNDANWDTLARASSILSGNAAAAGTTQSTSTPTAPWYSQILGGAIGLGSLFL